MTATTFTEGIQASLAPWAPPGSAFDTYNVALAGMFETVYSIVSDQGSPDVPDTYQAGWGALLDPTACAADFPVFLPWLALFVGAVVPIGAPPATALATILGEQGFARGQGYGGTFNSTDGMSGGPIVTAAQSQLTGTQNVTLLERTNAAGNPDAYWFILVVLTSQVVNATALTSAVNAVKPGGVQWTLVSTTTWIISEFETAYSTITLAEAAFASITALEGDIT